MHSKIQKQQYEMETGKSAEITIKYDSPEYLLWYINKQLNNVDKKPNCEKCKSWNDKSILANFCYNCGRALNK